MWIGKGGGGGGQGSPADWSCYFFLLTLPGATSVTTLSLLVPSVSSAGKCGAVRAGGQREEKRAYRGRTGTKKEDVEATVKPPGR